MIRKDRYTLCHCIPTHRLCMYLFYPVLIGCCMPERLAEVGVLKTGNGNRLFKLCFPDEEHSSWLRILHASSLHSSSLHASSLLEQHADQGQDVQLLEPEHSLVLLQVHLELDIDGA